VYLKSFPLESVSVLSFVSVIDPLFGDFQGYEEVEKKKQLLGQLIM
jgi:hypothetical protein